MFPGSLWISTKVNITDKMTNCCVEVSDPTPIHVASRIAEDHDLIGAGAFVESDQIEKLWADEKLVIRSLFDQIVSGIGPWCKDTLNKCPTSWFDGRYFKESWVPYGFV